MIPLRHGPQPARPGAHPGKARESQGAPGAALRASQAGPVLLAALLVLAAPLVLAQSPQQQVLERINVERWVHGQLPPLKGQANLDVAADGHSQAMGVRNFFMHCDPDTLTSFGQRMSAAGYLGNAAAENIAAGYADAAAVVQGWMGSPGHRSTILSSSYREVGTGWFLDASDQNNVRQSGNGSCPATSFGNPGYQRYWTQKFGRRDEVMPVVVAREAWQVSTCTVDVYLYGSGWASQYRLSNDGSQWSPWQPFSANVLWNLAGPAGALVTVHAQIRNGSGSVRQSQDQVGLALDCAVLGDALFANGFQ